MRCYWFEPRTSQLFFFRLLTSCFVLPRCPSSFALGLDFTLKDSFVFNLREKKVWAASAVKMPFKFQGSPQVSPLTTPWLSEVKKLEPVWRPRCPSSFKGDLKFRPWSPLDPQRFLAKQLPRRLREKRIGFSEKRTLNVQCVKLVL